jgi:hypothetical protein
MARRRHLDPALLDLFVRAGIPARYAALAGQDEPGDSPGSTA